MVSRRLRQGGRDRGAALVEFAVVLPLLLLVLIGMAELGIAFRDWLSISTASREGVRVGSAAGKHFNADCFILEAAAGALTAVPIDDIREVWIFQADTEGNPTAKRQRYKPAAAADPKDLLVCNDGWVQLSSNWPAEARSTVAGELDLMGVRIDFEHRWLTSFGPFGGTSRWTDDAIMRLEPTTFE